MKLQGGSRIGSNQPISSQEYPPWQYPHEQYPHEQYPHEQYPHEEYPHEQYPHEQYHFEEYPPEHPAEVSSTPQNRKVTIEVEPTNWLNVDPVLERSNEESNMKTSLEENDTYPPGEEPQEFIEQLKKSSFPTTNDEGTPTECKETREETGYESKTNKLPRAFECKKCLKLLARYSYAVNHCTAKTWQCEKCGQEIKQTNNINRHRVRCEKQAKINAQDVNKKSTVTGQNVNTCTFCGKLFKNPASLKTHLNVKHKEKKEGNLECEHCDFRTTEKSQLSKHLTLKHKAKAKFQCEECDFYCHSKSGLRKHQINVHKILNDKTKEQVIVESEVETEVSGEDVVETKNINGPSEIEPTGNGSIFDQARPEERGHATFDYESIGISQENDLPEPNIVIVGSTEHILTYAEL